MTTGHQLLGLMRFLRREEWSDAFEDLLQEHVGPALDTLDLDEEDVEKLLGEQWMATLWGCAFEDFLTRRLEPDGRNLAEAYLKRRGWKEDAQTRSYIQALRSSRMSLYEVSDIVPGRSLRARDLIRGGEPVQVTEGTATRTLKPWDHIAARIVPRGDGFMLAGGLLPFSTEAAASLQQGLEAALTEAEMPWPPSDEALCTLAPLFTITWLLDVVHKAMSDAEPVLYNSDGDVVVFHEIRFPLAAGATQKAIGGRLQTLPDLRRETAKFWTWLDAAGRPRRPGPRDAQGITWEVTSDDGRNVLGNVELQGRCLVLSVSSAQRAARGTALLQDLLGDNLRAPSTAVRTVDQMRREPRTVPGPEAAIPHDVATALVHDALDKRYRAMLDEPVGMIGDISPRAAIETAKGRTAVAGWLKLLENRSAASPAGNDPMATYDFAWMWHALGIEHLRR